MEYFDAEKPGEGQIGLHHVFFTSLDPGGLFFAAEGVDTIPMQPDPEFAEMPAYPMPMLADTQARHARIVRDGFWKKLTRLAGKVPFAEDVAAGYFCVIDPDTPTHVRGVVLLALAWFVVPAAAMPEFLLVFGLTDDAAVMALVARLVRRHVRERHYRRARSALSIREPLSDEEIWG
jgi:uncharacterized membrane protein YkvA (DUF1232 family)